MASTHVATWRRWGPDPGRIGLRRGIRAAIALPIALAVTLFLAEDDVGAVYAAFGTCGLLITADYAGSWQRRLISYLVTGVVGVPVLILGWAASQAVVSAVLVTALVAFVLSFIALMRGMLAVGAPALLLVYVVAVSVGGPAEDLPSYLIGWAVAVVVSTAGALLVLPHDVRDDIRQAIGRAFATAAEAVRASVPGAASAEQRRQSEDAFAQALADVRDHYDGKPFRPTGASQRDRALALLVSHLGSAGLLFSMDRGADASPLPEIDGRQQLVDALVDALHDLSRCMVDPTRIPSAVQLDAARDLHRAASADWVLAAQADGTPPSTIAEVIHADHRLRMAGVLGEQFVELTRQANGSPVEELVCEPPLPTRSWASVIRAHLSWHSPWLRIALRTGLGLALAVLIVQVTGVERGFWVLLGVMAVLRYDMTTTRRFAIYALVGTVVGVLLGTGVLIIVGGNSLVAWLVLPVTVFLAAYAPVVTSFPIGQAAFSMFILILLGIVNWPPDLRYGLVRIEDIAIGAGVALVVGVLMWPSGAAGVLHREVAAAIRTASRYVSLSVRSLVDVVTTPELLDARTQARLAVDRASETYDMAIMQRGPVARDTTAWAGATNGAHLLLAVGRILKMLRDQQPVISRHPDLVESLTQAEGACDAHWREVEDDLLQAESPAPRPTPDAPLPIPLPRDIATPDDAEAYVATVWTLDWLDHLDRIEPTGVPAHA